MPGRPPNSQRLPNGVRAIPDGIVPVRRITAALDGCRTLRRMDRSIPKHLAPRRRRRPVLDGLVVLAQYLALVAAGTVVTVMILRSP